MTKKQVKPSKEDDAQHELSLTFQKLSLATSFQRCYGSQIEMELVSELSDQDRSDMSFSNLQRKLSQVRNIIEKQPKTSKVCIKCKKNIVPKGYKNCIKCCIGNSVGQNKKIGMMHGKL